MDLRQLPVVIRRQVPTATLPDNYKAALAALAECVSVDEVAEWANKAAALATYARQANDTSLIIQAQKIQVRAERRAGELLEELYPHLGHISSGDATYGRPKLKDISAKHNLSSHRVGVMLDLAKVPEGRCEKVMSGLAATKIGITSRRVVKTAFGIADKEYTEKRRAARTEEEINEDAKGDKQAEVFDFWRSMNGGTYTEEWDPAILGCTTIEECEEFMSKLTDIQMRIVPIRDKFKARKAALRKLMAA